MTGYQPNIPLATDKPSVSQGDIETNFQVIDEAWSIDHVPLENDTNQGFSNKTSFIAQASDPTPAAGIGALYVKTIAAPGDESLFYVNNDGPVIRVTGPTLDAKPVYAMIPGGILLQWGTTTFVVSNLGIIISPAGGVVTLPYSYTANAYNVQLTSTNSNFLAGLVSTNKTSFTVDFLNVTTAGSYNVVWLAIGSIN
jgi:hypothetical protein